MTNSIVKSEKESSRFGMNILRVTVNDINTRELYSAISGHNADITILRVPCDNMSQISKLNVLGFPYFQADTLVYYYTDFEKYTPLELKNKDVEFEPAQKEDAALVSGLVDEIFPGYTNHYNSNPYIDKKNILEGYKEWVVDFIGKENKYVFLVKRGGKVIGFATCSVDDGVAEGVLYGVLPEAAGGGIYSDIIRYTQEFMRSRGIKTMKVSTQVQNYAVQKVWSREGFSMLKSYATIHINSLLDYSVLPKINFDITITEEDIKNYGELSGDLNPIHFDDLFAQKLGFDKRISHGLIANAEMSKYFGTEFPGPGTLFMGYSYKFLKPLYANQTYKVTISTPYYDEAKKIHICLVKIYDSANNLCLLSYNDLIKK